MKRKLLIIPAWYPSDISATSGIFVEEQAIVLSENYEVLVYPPVFYGMRRWLSGQIQLKAQVETRRGVRVYRAPMMVPFQSKWYFGILSVVSETYYQWVSQWHFKKIVARWGKPDLIHAHVVLPAGWVAMKLGRKYNVPVILTEHSGPFSMHLRSSKSRRLVRKTLDWVNRVVAVSPALVQQIHDFHPAVAIDVVGNVIRTNLFTPATTSNLVTLTRPGIRFLSIAALIEEKGISYLLKAAQLLIQRGVTNFELVIGGDGPKTPRLKTMADELGVSDRCRFLGMLDQAEVKNWMQKCDVFVLPSLAETFGVVLGEAMACGKPVIATRCGGPEFVVTPETGLLVNVADPVALAEAMAGFISPGKYIFDASQIRQSVHERFGEEAFVRNISAIYEQVWAGYSE